MTHDGRALEAVSTEQAAVKNWVRASWWAGLASLLTCGVLGLPAVALGVLAVVRVRKLKGGRKAFRTVVCNLIASALVGAVGSFMAWSAYSGASAMAKHINCIHHLKSLATGLRLCVSDNRDYYPSASEWCDALQRYADRNETELRNWRLVPMLPTSGVIPAFHCPATSRKLVCSFAFNEKLSGKREADVAPDTVMLFESRGGWNASGSLSNAVAHHPRGHTSVAFADGSVQQIRLSELGKLRWDP
jgi:hypothetical protein